MYHDIGVLNIIYAEGLLALSNLIEHTADPDVPAVLRFNLEFHARAMMDDRDTCVPVVMAFEDIREMGCELGPEIKRDLECSVLDCLVWRLQACLPFGDRDGFVEATNIVFSISRFWGNDLSSRVGVAYWHTVKRKFPTLGFNSKTKTKVAMKKYEYPEAFEDVRPETAWYHFPAQADRPGAAIHTGPGNAYKVRGFMPSGTTFFARPVHNWRNKCLRLPNGEGYVHTDLMLRLRYLEDDEYEEEAFDAALFPRYLKHHRISMGSRALKLMSEVRVEPAPEGGAKFPWCPEAYKSEGYCTLLMDRSDGPAYLRIAI